jgi:hypothetical protein
MTVTIAYKYRINDILSDPEVVNREMDGSRLLYNDLIAIERRRRTELTKYWAERGGYTELLTRHAEAREAAKLLDGDERKAAFKALDALQREIYAAEAQIVKKDQAERFAADPAYARRKQRTAEIRAEAETRGEALTPAQISDLLDAEPDCVTEGDRLRIALVAEAASRGKRPSAKAIAQAKRAAGHVGPTEHIEEAARAAGVAAYQARGVTHGTRGFVADAVDQAIKKSAPWPPSFKPREHGRDSFGVCQVVDGNLAAIFNETHTQIQIKTMPDRPSKRGKLTTPGSRRSARLIRLRVRIGSEGKRKSPVWAEFEAIAHRQLPPDAVIRQARVTRERVGIGREWYVSLTLQLPDTSPAIAPSTGQWGTVAVDLGFRSHNGDLRVAYTVDDRGKHGPITTPARRWVRKPMGRVDRSLGSTPQTMSERLRHADGLHEMLSRAFTAMHGNLVGWLAGRKDLPEWLVEETKTLASWRSQARLASLVSRWRDNRFEGDEMIFADLTEWRKRWRHLFSWSEHETRGAVRARREHYRLIAAKLARTYAVIVISDTDLASTKRRKPKEETELVMVDDLVRRQAQIAAPGELRAEIARAAKRYGAIVVKAKPDSTTCHGCGATCTYDRAKRITHECEHCGVQWDQDHNAAINMLRGYTGTRPARAAQ